MSYPPPAGYNAAYPPQAADPYAPGSVSYGQPAYGAPNPAYPPTTYGAPPPGAYGAPPQAYGAPAYGAPPPQAYGAPAYGAPPQAYGAPPPGAYGAPPPQAYGAPPQAYGAPPQAYGAPPQQYGAPPPQQYGAPQPQYGAPPPQQYGAPPPQQYGAPQPQYGAPQPQYGAPAPQQPPAQSYAPQQVPAAAPAPAPVAAPAPAPAPVAAAAPAPAPAPVAQVAASLGSVSLGFSHRGRPTIVDAPNFNPEADAERLRKAMKGAGTDEPAIIEVFTKRSAKQRLQIALYFKTMYGKDLLHDLKSETSFNFKDLIASMMHDNAHFEAWTLRRAMKGAGTDEQALIEIICTKTNAEIRAMKAAYVDLYPGRDIEKDVRDETSGHFKRLLTSCLTANRQEDTPVDREKARQEAADLHAAGEKKWGTDESKFNHILAMRSFDQLMATFEEYRKVSSYDIIRTIEHEMSGDVKGAFYALIMCVKDRPRYFAERLYKAMKGAGTNDDSLIRIIVSRSEIDMVEIKECFFNLYNKSLAKMIKDDVTGYYRDMLVGIVGEG